MKPADDRTCGFWVPPPPSLEAVLDRLDTLSVRPEFSMQRELALSRALRMYLSASEPVLLEPLAQETHLAKLLLYADFYPEDGQLTLIEQLRDVITEHIPDEERRWLDPLKHSYMDLVEILPSSGHESARLFRSLGNARSYRVRVEPSSFTFGTGQVMLTRLIRQPDDPEADDATIAGGGLVLSAEDAKSLYESVSDYRREMELAGGSFELGDWPEFTKRFGHMLLWQFARMRMAALLDVVTHIRYVTPDGRPYLYAIALYEHHQFSYLEDSLSDIEGFRRQPAAGTAAGDPANRPGRTWTMAAPQGAGEAAIVARFTLTSSQLWVECDSRERLDSVKHALAAAYGFSLHFRGETNAPPRKEVSAEQLVAADPLVIPVSAQEDRALLGNFLETVYLDWADQESPILRSQTPRHAASSAAGRSAVEAVIAAMERYDLGLERTGVRAFDYDKLRAHVGLEEKAR
jgi:hypothetical protein